MANTKWPFPYEFESFLNITKPFHLTIQDIVNMKPGERMNILFFDRNVGDIVSSNDHGSPLSPKEFFRDAYQMTFTKTQDLKGKAVWKYEGVPSHERDFEFEIEYTRGYWYPVENGLVKMSSGELCLFPKPPYENWESYNKNTRVGWRGPSIKMKLLDYVSLPDVYYDKDLYDRLGL